MTDESLACTVQNKELQYGMNIDFLNNNRIIILFILEKLILYYRML
jgi:hypothetical protein